MGQAKWWGWGDEGVVVHARGQAGPRALSRACPGARRSRHDVAPVGFDDLDIPESTLSAGLRSELEAAIGSAHVSTDALDRVVHARGKSLRDLVRHRRGDVGRLPDVVVRPADEDEVAAVVRAAIDADAVVIPFGGGTNISGSLEAPADEERDIVSVDLGRMDQVLAIDEAARLARVQPGVFGPRPRGAAQRARVDGRPLPRQLQLLDARRLDRDALVRDAVRQVRRRRRPDPSRARGHSRGNPGHPARCHTRRRVPACARWCWAARGAWGSSARRRCTSIACPSSA